MTVLPASTKHGVEDCIQLNGKEMLQSISSVCQELDSD